MSTATLNRQEFARLVQDRLIAAGEDRPLEFDTAGFTLLPRGISGAEAVPLAPFHQMYLAAPQDLEFVVKQFVEYWKGAQKQAGAAISGPTFVSPGAAAKFSQPPAQVHSPRPRASGIGTVLLVIGGGLALFVVMLFAVPLILVLALLNAHNGRPGQQPVAFGPMSAAPALPAGATTTEIVGGAGGGERQLLDSQLRPLVGVAFEIDEHWDNEGQVLSTLQPIFDAGAPVSEIDGRPEQVEIAKEGYVVGGLLVDASKYVNAVKVVYVRRNGESLDLSDTYESEWLGKPRSGEPRKLAGDGQMVLGLQVKQGLVLDAVGLIVRPAPQIGPPAAEDAVGRPINPFEPPAEVTPP